MSNEEMNKKMEFILEQQAQFAADIEATREIQKADAKLSKEEISVLKDAVLTVVGLVGTLTQTQRGTDERISELTQAQAHTDDRINALVQAQARTDESFTLLAQAQTRTEEGFKLLTESQARTDERLNIFINVVERHISGNGGSESRA